MASVVNKLKRHWIWVVPAVVLVIDQLTKLWAINRLQDGDFDLFWTLRFRLVRNSGTIFGLGGTSGIWLALVGLFAVGLLAFLLVRIYSYPFPPFQKFGYSLGYTLLLGGALGNLGDRFFRGDDGFATGSVVDFIDLQWWPIFNVADSAITIGIAVIIWFTFLGLRYTKNTNQNE